jgi:hypothetical protein
MTDELTLTRAFHDIRNTLGAVLLNLEVATDPKCEASMLREAATDALAEARKIDAALGALRLLMARKKEGE